MRHCPGVRALEGWTPVQMKAQPGRFSTVLTSLVPRGFPLYRPRLHLGTLVIDISLRVSLGGDDLSYFGPVSCSPGGGPQRAPTIFLRYSILVLVPRVAGPRSKESPAARSDVAV